MGIAPEEDRIFAPFRQTERGASAKQALAWPGDKPELAHRMGRHHRGG
jgi:hypothetical protein